MVVPITVKQARRVVAKWHRHLPDIQGGLFATSVWRYGELVGVGIAGHPARVWQDQAKLVISRCALDGERPLRPHVNRHGEYHQADSAASKIYASLSQAAKALGWLEVWTYTLPDEPGISVRAAGFVDMGLSRGGGARPRWSAEESRSAPRTKAALATRPTRNG